MTETPAGDMPTTLIRSLQTRLRAFIRKRVAVREDVEDILQEILYQLFRVNILMQPVEQVSAWLFRAAKNEIVDRSRKKKEEPFPAFADDGDWPEDEEFADALFGVVRTPEDEYLRELIRRELETALEELSPNQREAFEKTELQGYSFKRLAEETGTGVNTLLSRKHKAVIHLRERLRDLYDDILET